MAGASPEDIQVSQSALSKTQQDLSNLYGSVSNTLADAYTKANDAVRNQLSGIFISPDSQNPQLSIVISNQQLTNDTQNERVQAGVELASWQSELVSLNSFSSSSTLDAALQKAAVHLDTIQNLLNSVFLAVTGQISPTANSANYKAAVASGQTEVNAALTEVNNAAQGVASQKVVVEQAQAALALKLAGSTKQDIDAEQAQVEAAQANVESIKVELSKSYIKSPIDGVITVQNAKVGQVASPNDPLVSVISQNNLEVDAEVPEVDIGKIQQGDTVAMTLDAFPGENFSGKVFYIDPAETVIQGVVDYKVKVSFDQADKRLKSGLTANLNIKTQEKDNVLILPQFAILQTDQGNFVEVLQSGAVKKIPVVTGIQDQMGNVEIVSGVSEGDQVINIGLQS